MSRLSRVGKSQTSIARTVRQVLHRRKLADRHRPVVPAVPLDSGAGGIAAVAVDQAAVRAAVEAGDHSNY
jgi:hypothetical protein